MGKDLVGVSQRIESDNAFWFKGAPSASQSGMSSSRALVSITAPERIWEPSFRVKLVLIGRRWGTTLRRTDFWTLLEYDHTQFTTLSVGELLELDRSG